MLSNWEQFENTEKLRQRVYKGIPNQVRGQAWCALMGVGKVKETQEGTKLIQYLLTSALMC